MTPMLSYVNDSMPPVALFLTKDKNNAADLVQQTCLRIIESNGRYENLPFDDQKRIATTIMKNIFIDKCRRVKYRQTTMVEDFSFYNKTSPSASVSVEFKSIFQLINNPDDVHVSAFNLYYTGYKYREISVILNRPMNTIRSDIRAGKSKIIKQLEL